MDETITLFSSQDLTTLARTFDIGALSEPSDELTERYEYIVSRQEFRDAYASWDHEKSPLLELRDQILGAKIYLGKPSAGRVHEGITANAANVQLF